MTHDQKVFFSRRSPNLLPSEKHILDSPSSRTESILDSGSKIAEFFFGNATQLVLVRCVYTSSNSHLR
ncbi:hypothetical protein [Nostoc sp. CALU 1950]|uniref:hypothetical protein n=1 Tax=Nostoc sp. CALU 1950 TaxID=3104321 RepID=UPI003EB9F20B